MGMPYNLCRPIWVGERSYLALVGTSGKRVASLHDLSHIKFGVRPHVSGNSGH